jgi:hypothetical protein
LMYLQCHHDALSLYRIPLLVISGKTTKLPNDAACFSSYIPMRISCKLE